MKQTILVLIMLVFVQACNLDNKVVTLKINENKIFQEMHSFGASDSWRCQFVGENWPLEKRNKIADLLFSMENDKAGNPIGIGLSSWRFYLGSGSEEQGNSSNIRNVWRRSECFLDSLGQYDWTKCVGQRWFLQAAKKRGVPEFQMFTISPPVFYTKNGFAHSVGKDFSFNLKSDKYDDYSNYISNVITHFKNEEGIHFNYISPFNEPQWDWGKGSQEGTPASNEELYLYLKHLSESLYGNSLETKIIAGEAGSINYLYKKIDKSNCSDQINMFFNPESPLYLGDFKNLEYTISGHSYFSTWPLENQIAERQKLAKRIEEINTDLDYWQTEFCVLEKNDEIQGGWGRDLGMPTALYVARVIHSDLTIVNARSWDWWTALSQFNFKDGLIHLDDGLVNGVESDTSKLNHQLKFNGSVRETKLLWALGNFSRFVRPGMVRIDVQTANALSLLEQASDLQISGFKDPETGNIILVFINHKKQDKRIQLDGIQSENAALYITDKKRSLEKTKVDLGNLIIPKRSVSTLVIGN